jgi:PAS domain S-box-containing protein
MQSKLSTPTASLTRRSIIFAGLILFIILFGTTILLSWKYYQDSKVKSLRDDQNTNFLISLVIDQHIQKIVKTMSAFCTRPLLVRAVKEHDSEKAKIHLVSLIKSDPDIDTLIITDKEGTLWCSYPERPEIIGTNLAYREWYRGISKDWKVYVSNMVLSIVSKKDAAFQIAVPIFDESGKVIGIMVNTQRAIELSKIMKKINLDPGTYINITDRMGNLVYSSRFAYEKEIAHYPFYFVKEKVISAKNSTMLVKDPYLEGRKRYITYAPIADIEWSVFIGRDSRTILMGGFAYYIQIAVISLLLFILIIGSLVYLRKNELTRQLSAKLESEKKLLISEKLYRSLFDSMLNAFQYSKMIFDQGTPVDYIYLDVNRSFESLTGLKDVIGRKVSEVLPGILQSDPELFHILGRVASSGNPEKFDIYVNALNQWFSASAYSPAKEYFVVIFEDITERKQAEEKLQESEKKLRRFYESGMIGVMYWNMEGKITGANDRFLQMIGYTRGELEADKIKWDKITPPEFKHLDDNSVKELKATGINANPFEKEYIRKDGTRIAIMIAGAMLDEARFNGVAFVLDITERKQAEESLRESEYKYKSLIENIPNIIFTIDLEGKITFISRKVKEILGYENAETINMNILNFIPKEDHQRALENLQKGMKGEKIKHFQVPMITKSGEKLLFECSFSRIYKDGAVVGAQGTAVDITERKRIENALRQSEEKYRLIFEYSPLGILSFNEKGVIVACNDNFVKVIGSSQEKLIGLNMLNLPDKNIVSAIQKALSGGHGFYEGDYSSTTAKKITPVRCLFAPMDIGGGRVSGGVGIIEDITDRRKIEEVQNRLAAIVESADDSIISKDLEGIITSWNEGAEIDYGYKQEEVIGQSMSLLMPPYHTDEHKEILEKIRHGEKIKHYETRRRRKDGQLIDVSLTVSPIKDTSGKIIGASTIARNITERKKAEREIRILNEELEQRVLQRTAQLNEVNKELEKFSYSVSHDLRAPLRGIDGWSLALLEDYGDKLDDQARTYIERVRSQTQLMGMLINDLLNLSRITRIEPQLMPLDLTVMAQSLADRLREEKPERRIEFIIQPDLRAHGDNHLINIALNNLFDNAVKFTGKRSLARIEFGEAEIDGGKAFFVRDNGAGFDMANADKLFGTFQRLHKASEFSGTGIGLATVQRIINRHGGRIWAEAKPNEGATFYFTLKEAT